MEVIMEVTNNSNILSKVQTERKVHGDKYEDYIIDKYGLAPAEHEDHLIDNVGKIYHIDAFFKNMMIEITTSVKDGKEAKLRLEAKLFKQKFPNKYFVILIKKISNPRLDGYDSHYDHLVSDPNIDKVLVGEDEFKTHLKKPTYKKLTYKKLTNNKIGDNNDMKNIIVDRCIELGEHGFLANFVKSYEGSKSTSRNSNKGETAYQKSMRVATNTMNLIKNKNPKSITEVGIDGKVPYVDIVLDWGYVPDILKRPHEMLSGNLGTFLSNGAAVWVNTDNPSYSNMGKFVRELYVDKNASSPKKKNS